MDFFSGISPNHRHSYFLAVLMVIVDILAMLIESGNQYASIAQPTF